MVKKEKITLKISTELSIFELKEQSFLLTNSSVFEWTSDI